MASSLEQVLEWLGLAGLAGLAAFIPWTKVGLGAALALLAVFFPNAERSQTVQSAASESEASPSNNAKNSRPVARDVVRLGFLLVGLVLLVGAIGDGHQNYVIKQPLHEAKAASRLKAKEQTPRYQPSAESNSIADRTLVRSESRPSLVVTSSPASKTNAPSVPKWKFLHKGVPE